MRLVDGMSSGLCAWMSASALPADKKVRAYCLDCVGSQVELGAEDHEFLFQASFISAHEVVRAE